MRRAECRCNQIPSDRPTQFYELSAIHLRGLLRIQLGVLPPIRQKRLQSLPEKAPTRPDIFMISSGQVSR